MHEAGADILQLDPLTGRPSFIHGPRIHPGAREAGTRLNRERTHGIAKAAEANASSQSLPIDVRTAPLARTAAELNVPLIPLEALGLSFDEEDHIVSRFLLPLNAGAEARPFADEIQGVVYKLFDLRETGALGKKIELRFENPWEAATHTVDATLFETLEKLAVLHEAGAHPTEIIGLAESGDYLIVKQSIASPHGPDLNADRQLAAAAMKALSVRGGIRGSDVRVFWLNGHAWLIGDLHRGNIMRDDGDNPTIIDALIGSVPLSALEHQPVLSKAIQDARALREGRAVSSRKLFEDVDENNL